MTHLNASNWTATTEADAKARLLPARSASFLARLMKRSKPYLLPLVALDCIVIYYFSLHLSFAQAANSLVIAIGNYHPLDPRLDAVMADAQAQLTKSILSLLAATGGAMLCVAAFASLCWSARCLRKRRRLAAQMDAILWEEDRPRPVKVVDISEGGCRISLRTPPDCGSSVRVAFGQAEALAKVVWRSDRHAGLQFLAPMARAVPGADEA
jgi:hypothetical protein